MNKLPTCTNWEELEAQTNKEAIVTGLFQAYQPYKKGKGAGHMFWNWEIRLADDSRIPAIAADYGSIDFSKYEGKQVQATAKVFYGIVIGSPDPNMQSATGYRLDIKNIELI
ncbi:MAG: hypothetical protein GY810_09530 [Aureispira sp.]|nr:hypothetical protein [Aureispira sp.]